MEQIDKAPLRVDFTIMRYGWECEAKKAAIRASYARKDHYVPEMEAASAYAYRFSLSASPLLGCGVPCRSFAG